MNALVQNYIDAKQAIYDHVGFVEDWVIYSIEEMSEMYWQINESKVKYATTLEDLESDGDFYSDEIYAQRFYEKHIYEGQELTMIFCNPHMDGMTYFRLFDNSKRINEQ